LTETITLHNVHGTFICTPADLDVIMDRHLPASPAMLRELVAEHCSFEVHKHATVSEPTDQWFRLGLTFPDQHRPFRE